MKLKELPQWAIDDLNSSETKLTIRMTSREKTALELCVERFNCKNKTDFIKKCVKLFLNNPNFRFEELYLFKEIFNDKKEKVKIFDE